MKTLLKSIAVLTLFGAAIDNISANVVALYPEKGATNVCVDTKLRIDFDNAVEKGTKGMIRIFDNKTGLCIDSINVSIPDGPSESRTYPPEVTYTKTGYDYARAEMPTNRTTIPGTPTGEAEPTPHDYQLNIIGGFTDGFHYHPIIINGKSATIALHNNVLDYGGSYTVTVDKSALESKGFNGIKGNDSWTFTTKLMPVESDTIRVNADGSGDFATVQGALDMIPDFSPATTVILVGEGDYEEIVYARNKTNVIIKGAGMDKTRVHYANNEVFNPHPMTVKTNEYPGSFPSRRAAFMLDNCHDIQIQDICIATDLIGQAEGLLLSGERIALYGVHIIGSGDALQANGTIYMEDCELDGGGDTILGRGSLFARKCNFRNDGGPFSWVRNTQGNHGDVFVECTFSCPDGRQCDYGRTKTNHGSSYPHAEFVVINCTTRNLIPEGWSSIGEPTATMLEYNTTDATTGLPADNSNRHPYSRQLNAETDAAAIKCYSTPAFVLKGWHPTKK